MSEDQGVVSNSQWLCQTFESLSNHIPLGDNDIIELDISDPEDLGLFIFPEEYVGQRKLSLALTSAIPTATFLVQPLMSFIEYIPAKRFGIRIKSSQRMSVFAQIDISEDKVYEISRWIIGNEEASKLSKCVSIFGKACGCALEINKHGTPRLHSIQNSVKHFIRSGSVRWRCLSGLARINEVKLPSF